MNYTKKKLNRSLIEKTISSYLGNIIKPSIRKSGEIEVYRYSVDTESILDVYYNTDETTTLCCTGKKPELADVLAREILEQCSVSFPNPLRALYLKGFSQDNINKVLDKISHSDCTLTLLSDTDIAKRYEVSNSTSENVKIHYFPSSGAVNIQGKGYSVYSTILASFDTLISVDDVIESNLLANNIENITTQELKEAMRRAFPNSYPFLRGALENIISSSFFLTKIENEDLPDYSWMVFPLLRGLEGVIKKLLRLKGIVVNKTFAEVFKPVSTGAATYEFIEHHSNMIGDSKYCSTLESCYNYLVANRHGIFHVNSIISSTRQITRDEAIGIFNEIVELIDKSCSSIIP